VPTRAARRPTLTARLRGRPGLLVVLAFAVAVAVVAVLLSMPVATEDGQGTDALAALFMSTSAVCVTGLSVVDLPVHFSLFGEVVLLVAVQVGGLGIVTLTSLLGLLVFRRLGLRSRLTAATESKAVDLGDVRRLVLSAVAFAAVFEALTAVVLIARFATTYDEPLGRAAYLGVFHAVSAYNNAGFALYSDNMIGFVTDPVVSLALCGAVIAGGLGLPVLVELRRELRSPRTWSLHTRVVLGTSAVLLLVGPAALTALEWTNPGTLGGLGVPAKLLAGFFLGVMPRTAGFNSVDVGALEPASLLVTDVLMLIGGAPAGTAGGIKVTTFALLAFVILAEARGTPDVQVAGRRLPPEVQRQAVSVALLSIGFVVVSTLALQVLTARPLDVLLFEVVSAFGTVGLSTGITADLPAAGQLVLIVLMFVGRLGPAALASALALRSRPVLYRLPEERPVVG
jgi:trk system potassium uptake protein